jgi:TolB-like protein/Tfp pilus assembly protein PilF
MSFIEEFKRRNIFRIGIAYAVSASVLLQIVDLVLDNFTAPDWVMQAFILSTVIGFPFALLFAWVFEMTQEGGQLEKNVDRSKSTTHATAQKMNRSIIIGLAIAVVLLLVDKLVATSTTAPQPQTSTTTQYADALTAVDVSTDKSIAVLPFVNMSSDPEQEYFADGISEEILNLLAKIDDLKVTGRTSSFSFKGTNENLSVIGNMLGVNHILEGSVRKSGTRIRVTAQLIKVDDGFHMWSETYDRELNDVFTIQDEISAAILVQLKAQLLSAPLQTVTTDARAYGFYLQAKQRIYERNRDSIETAIVLLNKAIEIDVSYAPAHAQLGIANLLASDTNYGTMPYALAGARAKKAFDQALQLDPQNAEALAGMGLYFSHYEPDHQRSIGLLQQALSINPTLENANVWLSTELSHAGELRAALRLYEQTYQRDPLHRSNFINLQQALVVFGQNDRALEMIEERLEYRPNDASLLSAYGQVKQLSGDLAEARMLFKRSHDKEPLNAVNNLWFGFTALTLGEYELAVDIAPNRNAVIALNALGRVEEALTLSKQLIDKGDSLNGYFSVLLANGRFEEIAQLLESRWPSLNAFSEQWPEKRGYGSFTMISIATAYRELGNQPKFDEAMAILKSSLAAQQAAGADNTAINQSHAMYAMLSGDRDAAIGFLEKAFQQGFQVDTHTFALFKPLEGNPRFDAAKAAADDRFEEELAKVNGGGKGVK